MSRKAGENVVASNEPVDEEGEVESNYTGAEFEEDKEMKT